MKENNLNSDTSKRESSEPETANTKSSMGALLCLPLLFPPDLEVGTSTDFGGLSPITIEQSDHFESLSFSFVENSNKKFGAGEVLATNGLKKELERIEESLQQEGISAEQQKDLLLKAMSLFSSRVLEVGPSFGWSKTQAQELVDFVFSIEVDLPSCTTMLKDLSEKKDQNKISPEQVKERIEWLRVFAEMARMESFGLRHGLIENPTIFEFGKPNWHDNACGPIALYYLLQSEKGDRRIMEPKDQQKLYDDLYRKVEPGKFGSDPARLPAAVKEVTNSEYELRLQCDGSWDEAQRIIDRTLDAKHTCVVKYGSSLLSQHYDCLLSRIDMGGIKAYCTASGYIITEKRLKDMMSQLPYSNHVWTAHSVDIDKQRTR